jgi:hypothetical protein
MARKAYSRGVIAIESLAQRNLGIFTSADTAAWGLSKPLLSYHTRPGGRWVRVFPGVFAIAGLPADGRQHLLAALSWGGPDAVLSHRTAAAVHGLDGIRAPEPELWTLRVHAPPGLIAHRGLVPPSDVVRSGPLRLTTVSRTILDLASVLTEDDLELVVESALRKNIHFVPHPSPGVRGGARLRRVLARRPPDAPPTESELETRYVQLIRGANVPVPVRQHRVFNEHDRCIGRLDLCWPDAGLWVELDGRATHDLPEALLNDRRRQNELASRLQWIPLRFTWDDVTRRPESTVSLTEDTYHRRVDWLATASRPAT